MPGFKTHYLFGRNAISNKELNENEHFLISYPQSYHLGLQGPDVFFYRALNWVGRKNIGNIIHHNNATAFFSAMMDSRNKLIHKKDRNIADAYICGFMAHYTLDTYVHPYIFWRTNSLAHKNEPLYDFGNHVFLETDIDNTLHRHYTHTKPSDFSMGNTITLSLREHAIISHILYNSVKKVFPNEKILFYDVRHSIDAMRIEANLMKDPTGIKKKGVRLVEKIIFGHAVVSPMIPSDTIIKYKDPCNLKHIPWKNPWDKKVPHNESVYDLMDKAKETFLKRLHLYSTTTSISKRVTEAEREMAYINLIEDLGDLSYDSGLPL